MKFVILFIILAFVAAGVLYLRNRSTADKFIGGRGSVDTDRPRVNKK